MMNLLATSRPSARLSMLGSAQLVCLLAVGATSLPAGAAELNTLQLLSQAEFRLLSQDLGAALSFKPLIPAESMGITGVDVGVALTGTRLAHRDIWSKAAAGATVPATLPVPTFRLHKGLPLNIDVGVTYAAVPSSNVKMLGGELRWAVLPGSALTPALALRAGVNSLSGVDQLSLRTVSFDVSVSKGFTLLTPYGGVGTVAVTSRPSASSGLREEKFNQTKVFAGLNLNLGLSNFTFETDRTGGISSYGVKYGLRF